MSQITVTDLGSLGKMIWSIPAENNVEELLINIKEIDRTEANQIIERQPEFLKDADGLVLSREESIRNLQLKVRMFVGVKIKLEISENAIIRGFNVLEPSDQTYVE